MNFEGQSIIDMLFELLGQLLIPNWSNLILLLPWVLVVLVVVVFFLLAVDDRFVGDWRVLPAMEGWMKNTPRTSSGSL